MSGLLEVGAGKRFLSIMKVEDKGATVARFVQKVSEDSPGAISRTNKNGKTVYENHFGGIKGILTGLAGKEVEFNNKKFKVWELSIVDDEGSELVLSLPLSSSTTRGILWRLGNANLTEEVTILAGYDREHDRNFSWVKQFGDTVPMKWYKDNMGDMPDLEQKTVKGEKVWDDTKQIKFLFKFIKDELEPIFAENRASLLEKVATVEMTADEQVLKDTSDAAKGIGEEEDDDLPFVVSIPLLATVALSGLQWASLI